MDEGVLCVVVWVHAQSWRTVGALACAGTRPWDHVSDCFILDTTSGHSGHSWAVVQERFIVISPFAAPSRTAVQAEALSLSLARLLGKRA